MKKCLLCRAKFGNRVKFGDRWINTQRRKYCIECSPVGAHNTKKLEVKAPPPIACKCGASDHAMFYLSTRAAGKRRMYCKSCFNKICARRQSDNSSKMIKFLGGRCMACGFFKWQSCLDLHHLDPKDKDPKAASMRSWSWKRILTECKKCILLCKNCHAAFHAGEDVFEERIEEATRLLVKVDIATSS